MAEKNTATVNETGSVYGNQVWKTKPDKKTRDANLCIWQQAGVVKKKSCNNFYDCTTCNYDLGMAKRVSEGKEISWQNAMRRRGELDRICRHSLTNRIARRICAYDYECAKCDFDQFFEDVWNTKTGSIPDAVEEVGGFRVPRDRYFHKGHSWVRIESGGNLRVGMDDFALRLLGKADALDLPLMGKELVGDNAGWELKRKEHSAKVLSPVDGIVMEVNSQVRENPSLANGSPYEDGWLFVVRAQDVKKAIKPLMDDSDGVAWMSEEVKLLEKMIEDVSGPANEASDRLPEDIFGSHPDLGWQNLTSAFLKT